MDRIMLPTLILISVSLVSRSLYGHEPRVVERTNRHERLGKLFRALAENDEKKNTIHFRKVLEEQIIQEKETFKKLNARTKILRDGRTGSQNKIQLLKREALEADDLSTEALTLLHSDGISRPTANEKKLGKKLAHVNKLMKQQQTELKGINESFARFDSVRKEAVSYYCQEMLGRVEELITRDEEVAAAVQKYADEHSYPLPNNDEIGDDRKWFPIFTVMSKKPAVRNSKSDKMKKKTVKGEREGERKDDVYMLKELLEREGFDTGPKYVQRNTDEVFEFSKKFHDNCDDVVSTFMFKSLDDIIDALRLWRLSPDMEKFVRAIYSAQFWR